MNDVSSVFPFAGALAAKVGLVTGASGGIGRALALGLARAGADVGVHTFDDVPGGEETVAQIQALGRKAWLVKADIRNVTEINAMIEAVHSHGGRLDVLVNNAGITGWNAALDVTEALWDQVIDTNLKGTFFCTTAAARKMRQTGGGSIINVSTVVALTVMQNLTVYAASKAGIQSLTRQLAVELAPFGVRVNAIAPGPTLVPRTLADDPDYAANWSQVMPLGRVAVPEDMVGAVLFFATQASGLVTGQLIAIDGGMTLPGRVPQESLDRGLARNS
ncbi:MAG: 3-oxoacyl-ACP reductase family protein [Deltaproteobacteria bacterium]|nr:3-oxoacyl-ACP reductase family protein [Deltaproteobacteria bacterium]